MYTFEYRHRQGQLAIIYPPVRMRLIMEISTPTPGSYRPLLICLCEPHAQGRFMVAVASFLGPYP